MTGVTRVTGVTGVIGVTGVTGLFKFATWLLLAYMEKGGDTGDYVPANFLDFPPNFRLRTRF